MKNNHKTPDSQRLSLYRETFEYSQNIFGSTRLSLFQLHPFKSTMGSRAFSRSALLPDSGAHSYPTSVLSTLYLCLDSVPNTSLQNTQLCQTELLFVILFKKKSLIPLLCSSFILCFIAFILFL